MKPSYKVLDVQVMSWCIYRCGYSRGSILWVICLDCAFKLHLWTGIRCPTLPGKTVIITMWPFAACGTISVSMRRYQTLLS